MSVDLSSLPVWAVILLLVTTTVAHMVGRMRLMVFFERLWRARIIVKIVREQRRMATLALPPGTELKHSGAGPDLVIRTSMSNRVILGWEDGQQR